MRRVSVTDTDADGAAVELAPFFALTVLPLVGRLIRPSARRCAQSSDDDDDDGADDDPLVRVPVPPPVLLLDWF
jgi:hypothetical protein